MRHIIFDENPSQQYSTALLIKDSAFNKHDLQSHYVNDLAARGLPSNDVIAFTLKYDGAKKVTQPKAREYLGKLLPALAQCGVERIYCADAEYFKALTGEKKADPHLGYVLPCKALGFEDIDVVLGINHRQLVYNPNMAPKLDMSLQTVIDSMTGQYVPLGSTVVEFSEYPKTTKEINQWLEKLLEHETLSVDIETFGLEFHKCGIASITFTWSEHEGIAFLVDYVPLKTKTADNCYGEQVHNPLVKALLREFFEKYTGKLIFHNAPFDTKVMIKELWMNSLLDNEGLLTGLSHLFRDLDDTKIMAYLCLNTCSELSLSLKDLAHEFAGSWAQDEISDVRKIPADQLLQYNLIDGLSTFYLKRKFDPLLIEEDQADLYHDYFIPYQMDITQLELTGMPVIMGNVKKAKRELEDIVSDAHNRIRNNPAIQQIEMELTAIEYEKDYQSRKAKAKNPDKIKYKDKDTFPIKEFNPGSGTQLAYALYEVFGLPVIEKTNKGNPSTADDTIKLLKNHTQNPDALEFIEAVRDLAKADKILSTFIPPLENAILKEDGHHYLHGGFNLGGTVSGRLSSSKPNLQNIPSGSKFGKLIKSCFGAPKGWIFCGADFNSLEDYVSALTTKDPNKLKVYQGEKIYELILDGVHHHIRGDSTINYDGKTYTGDEFYAAYS